MPQIKVFLLASGAIAVRTLAALMAAASVRLMGVGTQPDRRQGRRGFAPTPIGAWCEQHQQPIAKIENVNDPAVINRIAACAPDIVLVFAFGQLLRSQLLELPTKACVNLHASLLPAYRGAAPINAAILNGDSVTGISVTQMERGLDSGPVYSRHNVTIRQGENAAELEDRLSQEAARIVVPQLQKIATHQLRPVPQNHEQASHVSKLSRDDGRVDFSRPANLIERQIRAYTPWPGAWFQLPARGGSKRIIITAASIAEGQHDALPGTILAADKHEWKVACGNEALSIETIVPQGKREMTGIEFLRGTPLQTGQNVNHETDNS